MSTTTQRQTDSQTETTTIDFTAAETEQAADVRVTSVYTDSWGTPRAVLAGDTYQAFKVAKDEGDFDLDWDTCHQKYDFDNKEQLVDATDASFDELEAKLAEIGMAFDREPRRLALEFTGPITELIEAAEEGDQIRVVYAKKNGNGDAEKTGTVRRAHPGSPEESRKPSVTFEREDGRHNTLSKDDSGTVAIWSGGDYPFMGAVKEVSVTRAE